MKPELPEDTYPPKRGGIGRFHPAAQWAVLLSISIAVCTLFELLGIPAALLIGPMLAGIIVAAKGGTIRLFPPAYLAAQALIGIMVAGAIDADILPAVLERWPLFFGVTVAVIAMSTFSGWILSRLDILPGTTAIWGTSAGAATSMMVMAEAFGADTRLVAFMQYLRLISVVALATIVARFWVGANPSGESTGWFSVVDTWMFAETLAITVFGALAGRFLKIPAGVFLVPFVLGACLNASGHLDVELPAWLLAIAYAAIGWQIGLGFNREILAHARRAFLPVFVSIIALIAFCGLLAVLLNQFAGVDALTAYLATSPGGMETVAIIAASSDVDISFVMALQTIRLLVIMAVGPPLARLVANRVDR